MPRIKFFIPSHIHWYSVFRCSDFPCFRWKTWYKQLLIGLTAVCYRYTRKITICGAKKFLLRVSRETWEPLAAFSSSTFKMPSRWSQIWWSYVQTCVKSLNYLLFTWKFNYSEVELFQNPCIKLDISSRIWCTQLEIWLIDATNLK